jgi:hypothetical protein
MCLAKVEFSMTPDAYGEFVGVGYKVFIETLDGEIRSASGHLNNNLRYPYDNWMEDLKYKIIPTGDNQEYHAGFHIFVSKESALIELNFINGYCGRKYVIRQVEYKNVVGFGTQQVFNKNLRDIFAPCVIARKIRVLSEEIGE